MQPTNQALLDMVKGPAIAITAAAFCLLSLTACNPDDPGREQQDQSEIEAVHSKVLPPGELPEKPSEDASPDRHAKQSDAENRESGGS